MHSPSISEYENENILKIHLSSEEMPCDSETCMTDHQGQIRGLIFISTVMLSSLAYDAIDVMDDYNFAMAFDDPMQISLALIDNFRKPSIELIVLAKQWG